MNYSGCVSSANSGEYLLEPISRQHRRNASVAFDNRPEGFTFNEFHHQVSAGRIQHTIVVYGNNVWMNKTRRRLCFMFEATQRLGLAKGAAAENLHRDVAIQRSEERRVGKESRT